MQKRRLITPVVLMFVAAAAANNASAQAFHPLTEEGLQAAIVEGKDPKALPPLDIVTGRVNRSLFLDAEGKAVGIDRILILMQRAPFYVTVLTPYQRVVAAVIEATRRFATPPPFSLTSLNTDGIVVHVSAGGSFPDADVIEDVVLKKGEVVIRPGRKSVTPSTVTNRAGASKPGADGDFYFSFDSIPEAPFQVICVGAAGNYAQTVVEDDIRSWKS